MKLEWGAPQRRPPWAASMLASLVVEGREAAVVALAVGVEPLEGVEAQGQQWPAVAELVEGVGLLSEGFRAMLVTSSHGTVRVFLSSAAEVGASASRGEHQSPSAPEQRDKGEAHLPMDCHQQLHHGDF